MMFIGQSAARAPLYAAKGDRLKRGLLGLVATFLLCRCAGSSSRLGSAATKGGVAAGCLAAACDLPLPCSLDALLSAMLCWVQRNCSPHPTHFTRLHFLKPTPQIMDPLPYKGWSAHPSPAAWHACRQELLSSSSTQVCSFYGLSMRVQACVRLRKACIMLCSIADLFSRLNTPVSDSMPPAVFAPLVVVVGPAAAVSYLSTSAAGHGAGRGDQALCQRYTSTLQQLYRQLRAAGEAEAQRCGRAVVFAGKEATGGQTLVLIWRAGPHHAGGPPCC